MPYKDPKTKKAKHAEYSRDYYEKNGDKVRKRAAELKREKRAIWSAFKSTVKCAHCGFSHPVAIDFHHVDTTNKRSVNVLAQSGKYKAAMEEIKKCIPLCANCHRIHHYEERTKKIMRHDGTKGKTTSKK
jgi:hypothetical protein